jgi:hypothetical protein
MNNSKTMKTRCWFVLSFFAIVALSSCKKECSLRCVGSAECHKGECECIEPNMIKFSRLNFGEDQISFIGCKKEHFGDNYYTYKSLASDCPCMEDVYLAFLPGMNVGGGWVSGSRLQLLYKDNHLGLYRSDLLTNFAFFQRLDVFTDPDYPEVYSLYDEWETPGGLVFCKNQPNTNGIEFRGHTSSDFDTLYLTVNYLDMVEGVVNNACDMKLTRVKKP